MNSLKTDRLLLRTFSATDYQPLSQICSSPEVMALALQGRPLSSREFSGLIHDHFSHADEEAQGLGTLCLRPDGAVIGFSGILPCAYLKGTGFAEAQDVELILVIDQKFWGQGYATEIARAVLQNAFSAFKYPRLIALVSPRNHRSLNVMRKLAMNKLTDIDTPDRGGRTVFEKRRDAAY